MKSKLILGDNPFFGINHRSVTKAAEYSKIKDDFNVAADVIAEASRNGIGRLMVSTHAELPNLLEVSAQRLEQENLPRPALSLVVPYAHKLNAVVADKGIMGLFSLIKPHRLCLSMIKDLLRYVSKRQKFPNYIFSEFITSELKLVSGYDVEYLCLQNIVTDMILGLDRSNIFSNICKSLERSGATPLFITMNPIELDKVLPEGVPICFHYNINGFMVQPSLEEVQEFVSKCRRPMWAMGVLASGSVSTEDALNDPYLEHFDRILYATSKPHRVKEFISQIENC